MNKITNNIRANKKCQTNQNDKIYDLKVRIIRIVLKLIFVIGIIFSVCYLSFLPVVNGKRFSLKDDSCSLNRTQDVESKTKKIAKEQNIIINVDSNNPKILEFQEDVIENFESIDRSNNTLSKKF